MTGTHCPSIAIIEDDRDIRETVREILLFEGYDVGAYANGREAIDGLRDCEGPCLILLDLMMPVMDGWEFLKARKQLGDTIVAIPVFIVSAYDAGRAREEKGVAGYLKKPVELDLLLSVVRRHCGPAVQSKAA